MTNDNTFCELEEKILEIQSRVNGMLQKEGLSPLAKSCILVSPEYEKLAKEYGRLKDEYDTILYQLSLSKTI